MSDDQHVDFAEYLSGRDGAGTTDTTAHADPEAHLAECAACRDELAELREIEASLASVPPEALLDGPPADADLLRQRVLRDVRGRDDAGRGSRAPLLLVAAASLLVAVVAGVLVGSFATSGSSSVTATPPAADAPMPAPVPGTRFVDVADPGTGARLTAHVVPMNGWVRVHADVAGVPAGERCRLVVVAADGHREVAGSWLVSPQGAASGTTLTGAAVVDPAAARAVVVENTAGRQFVRAEV